MTQTRERIAVLTELHERLEGLTSGVKEVLSLAQSEPNGPWGEVRGVVADLFHVDVDTAPLVEVALGEQAQFLVVAAPDRLFEWLAGEPIGVPTRVGLLRLDGGPSTGLMDPVDLSGEAGVMGRADQFVEAASDLVPLVRRLLGSTWFVDRLSTALRLWRTAGGGRAICHERRATARGRRYADARSAAALDRSVAATQRTPGMPRAGHEAGRSGGAATSSPCPIRRGKPSPRAGSGRARGPSTIAW